MLIYNGLGGAQWIVAIIAGFLLVTIRGAEDFGAIDGAFMAIVAGGLDIGWRLTRGRAALEARDRDVPRRVRRTVTSNSVLMHPSAGGHVFWCPVWTSAALVLALALMARMG